MGRSLTTSTLAVFVSLCTGPLFAAEYAPTPRGWVDFCRRYPMDCRPSPERRVHLTKKMQAKLVAINVSVNSSIKPVTDIEHHGVRERWDYAEDGSGDCEDFALVKRRELIQAGFPPGALLLAVVRTKEDNGHAVLMVRTTGGDFILDNLTPAVLHWTDTGYDFVKRQNPYLKWVYID